MAPSACKRAVLCKVGLDLNIIKNMSLWKSAKVDWPPKVQLPVALYGHILLVIYRL